MWKIDDEAKTATVTLSRELLSNMILVGEEARELKLHPQAVALHYLICGLQLVAEFVPREQRMDVTTNMISVAQAALDAMEAGQVTNPEPLN